MHGPGHMGLERNEAAHGLSIESTPSNQLCANKRSSFSMGKEALTHACDNPKPEKGG